MSSRSASTPFPSLIAASAADGGALTGMVSGWAALLWVVELLRSFDIPQSESRPWAMVSAILMRLVSGDFRLQGVEVATWTIRRGMERVDVLRVRVGGGADRDASADDFELTIRTVFIDRPCWVVPAGADAVPLWLFMGLDFENSAKWELGLRDNCAFFVTIS